MRVVLEIGNPDEKYAETRHNVGWMVVDALAKRDGDRFRKAGFEFWAAQGRLGGFRVRFMDNTDPWDAAYPGIELLNDETFVTTTYGHWTHGEEPYVVSVRFSMDELDDRLPRN